MSGSDEDRLGRGGGRGRRPGRPKPARDRRKGSGRGGRPPSAREGMLGQAPPGTGADPQIQRREFIVPGGEHWLAWEAGSALLGRHAGRPVTQVEIHFAPLDDPDRAHRVARVVGRRLHGLEPETLVEIWEDTPD